jgi:hypothetical protein
MSTPHLIHNPKILCGEIIGVSLILTFTLFVHVNVGKSAVRHNQPGHLQTIQTESSSPNVHTSYYNKNNKHLELRFPLRIHNDPFVYIRQVLLVFGGATLFIFYLIRTLKLERSFTDIAGWDVTIVSCIWNLIFAYAFGFVAVVFDWWFFFPDLITSHIWQIQRSQMVLGDVLFYPMAVIMGYSIIILVTRLNSPIESVVFDTFIKIIWFTIAITIALFGITFGSAVMKGMIIWLYIPFGIAGLILYNKFTGFELWSSTGLFVICEFGWDSAARIRGIWIFPDSLTHPALYFKEVCIFSIGNFPVIWQPEMTQMAFISGMICLVFFHLSRYMLNKKDIKRS